MQWEGEKWGKKKENKWSMYTYMLQTLKYWHPAEERVLSLAQLDHKWSMGFGIGCIHCTC